jgi:hypothetical protein
MPSLKMLLRAFSAASSRTPSTSSPATPGAFIGWGIPWVATWRMTAFRFESQYFAALAVHAMRIAEDYE